VCYEASPAVLDRKLANLTRIERGGELGVRYARDRNGRSTMLNGFDDDDAERDERERDDCESPAWLLAKALADGGKKY
jgi:hypothetical protein